MTTATIHHDALIDRSAVRFLLAHQSGRLITGDPATGETWVSLVDYRFGPEGALIVAMPEDEAHAHALREGGPCALTVMADRSFGHGPVTDEDGLATPRAIAHLTAHVEADVAPSGQSDAVRLYVRNVEAYLRREPAAP